MSLDLATIRKANQLRQLHFEQCKGWSLAHWMTALAGEVGEAANVIKKDARGDFFLVNNDQRLADELADTLAYLDMLANAAGIDLAQAYIRKFNIVSRRNDIRIYLSPNGDLTDQIKE